MYSILLSFHSIFRWLVLASLLYAIYRAYNGWFAKKTFTEFDNTIRHTTATIAHIQLILGISLYFISPIVNYFLHHYKDAVGEREVRFFGMEHILMMLIAITFITIGSVATKRKLTSQTKFKTMAIWFTIALLIVLCSIPWNFNPLTPARPLLRGF